MFTVFPVVSDPTSALTLHRLTMHPSWMMVYSRFFPPSPPSSPKPDNVVNVEDSPIKSDFIIPSVPDNDNERSISRQSQSVHNNSDAPLVRRSSRMKKQRVVISDFTSSDTEASSSSSGVYSARVLKRQASRTTKKTENTDDSASSAIAIDPGSLASGITFVARDNLVAKEWLLERFKAVHTGGQIRCVNSRC